MTDERELGILDYIILDHIRQYKAFDDYAMARRLHCSRLFLLERLERLLSEGYVTQEGEAFDLTPYGASAWVPLDLYHEAAQATEPDAFPLTQVRSVGSGAVGPASRGGADHGGRPDRIFLDGALHPTARLVGSIGP